MSPRLLHQMVAEAAERRPEGAAVRCDGEGLAWGELYRRSNGVARVLRDGGMERGERVAVWLSKALEVSVAFYGVLAAGGVLVPIDPRSPVDQVVRILRATGATVLVTDAAHGRATVEVLGQCPEIRRVLGIEADGVGEAVPWSTVLAEAADTPPDVAVMELDPAYVLHTSGSTGVPKLIQHTHHGAMRFVDWAAEEYGLEPEDRLSNHSSHHTCFATFDYYAAARVGAATVLLTPASLMMPASLAALLERERVSVWYSVPTALVQLSLRGGLEERELDALRWVLFAGETFPGKHLRRLREQLPGARLSHVYGSTEVNVCTFYHLSSKVREDGPLPIGKACPYARTEVVNEALETVPAGQEGELIVRGSTVMEGYWGDPERNRQVLVRRPTPGGLGEIWFRTGDRVERLADGNLAFVARADLQVKVRGHRVELGEVESALLGLGEVEEAVAFTVSDGEGSAVIRAAVVVTPGAEVDSRQLLDRLANVLPRQAVPAKLEVLAALPRTPTGKVDRGALQAAADGG